MAVDLSRDLDERLAALMASEAEAIADPWPLYRELVEQGPMFEFGPLVLITRHAEAKKALLENSGLSNRTTAAGSAAAAALAQMNDEEQRAYHEVSDFESMFMARNDGAAHERLRRIGHRAFTPRRIAAMRAQLQQYADDLLEEAAAHAEDGVADLLPFAYRLPLMAIVDMLEVPQSDRELIRRWSATIGENRRGVDAKTLLPALGAIEEFSAYLKDVVAERRAAPRESDLVRLLLDAEEGEVLTEEELTAMFVVLLFAGHETTTNLLATGTLDMLRFPDQWRKLVASPGSSQTVVEELLRYVSPTQWAWRVALEDYDDGDVHVPAGTTVAVMLAGANRDPRAFERPHELDLFRPDAKNHLGFGLGVHFCLGNALARLEGEVVFETLARRFPDAELAADPETLAWRGNAMFRSLVRLPVRLGADRGRG